jgi:hypothetical protein
MVHTSFIKGEFSRLKPCLKRETLLNLNINYPFGTDTTQA